MSPEPPVCISTVLATGSHVRTAPATGDEPGHKIYEILEPYRTLLAATGTRTGTPCVAFVTTYRMVPDDATRDENAPLVDIYDYDATHPKSEVVELRSAPSPLDAEICRQAYRYLDALHENDRRGLWLTMLQQEFPLLTPGDAAAILRGWKPDHKSPGLIV